VSNEHNPRDEAELDAFLARKSAVTEAYGAIEPVQPPEVLDTRILNQARGAQVPVAAKAAAQPPAPSPRPVAPQPAPPRPAPVAEDEDDDRPARNRPRWLVPAALAASVLVAVGVGLAVLDPGSGGDPTAEDDAGALGSLFAKRARERREAAEASESAEAADEAEVVELAPLPPPPVFEPEGPVVADLDAAIVLIRRELVLANQTATPAAPADEIMLSSRLAAADPESPAPPAAAPGATAEAVVQPRERRLGKILELYDGGNPDLAGASLEIFLRDFEDDPISQRILDAQPRSTDVAIE